MPEPDASNFSEELPDLKVKGGADGGDKPPRKTAVGGAEPSPQPWLTFTAGGERQPVPPASIYEFLQLQDYADFSLMTLAQQYLYQQLETSFFKPDPTKVRRQGILLASWNSWCLSSSGRKAQSSKRLFPDASFDDLTHYQVLQVLPDAEVGVISVAYEYLSRRFHPDNSSTRDAEKFKIIDDAWAVLSQRSKRRDYDKSLERAE